MSERIARQEAKQQVARSLRQAGKGDTPRPTDRSRYDSCPLWDNIGPDAREKRRLKAEDESELHEQIETDKISYEEYEV